MNQYSQIVDEEMIGAYLEGTLTPEERDFVQQAINADASLQDLVDDVYATDIVEPPYQLNLDEIALPDLDDAIDVTTEVMLVDDEPLAIEDADIVEPESEMIEDIDVATENIEFDEDNSDLINGTTDFFPEEF